MRLIVGTPRQLEHSGTQRSDFDTTLVDGGAKNSNEDKCKVSVDSSQL